MSGQPSTPATEESGNRIGMMHINPGSGPVINPVEADAVACIQHFITDLALDGEVRWLREPREDERGRYGFLLYRDRWDGPRTFTLIQMPGLALDRVRWRDGLDPWQFPRLYVDGSSWLWGFALSSASRALNEEGEE